MTNFVKGTCESFCPEQEAKLRIKEKLLHFYELKNGQKHVPGQLVKAFARSAAGVKAPRAKDLRTEHCLQQTIDYLLKHILLDKRKAYHFTYDFIFDRLRAVRQEMVMQNYNERQTLKLLEPMIMFLAYSRYRLCEEAFDNFDPKICEQHLQECLKRVLCCYDEIDINSLKLNDLKNRIFIESLYQLFNLGTIEALNRAIELPIDVRTNATFKLSFSIALNYHQGNLYRALVGMRRLPHILCAIASLKLQTLRHNLLLIFAHAYSSKQLVVPVEFVCQLANYKHVHELFTACKYYGIKVGDDRKSVHFQKTDLKADAQPQKAKHEDFVEDKLRGVYLPEVLLLKRL